MGRDACFIRNCTTELNELKKQLLNTDISRQAFSESDEKTKFYTGISNFVLLIHVFNLVALLMFTVEKCSPDDLEKLVENYDNPVPSD